MTDSRRTWIWVACVALLPLLGWWLYGLFDLDEGFYAAVVSEMNRRGEWITPFYNGKPWFEKPILLYWVAKPLVAVFGADFGPRLSSILASLATYGLIAWFVNRHFGARAAQLGVVVLSTSLLFVAAGRMMLTDPLLALTFTACMVFFWESLSGDLRWRVASAGMLGLAILAKGPVAGLFFLLIVGVTAAMQRDLRPKLRGGWLLGTLLLAGVVASWYVPCYLANGQVFVQEFLIDQNIGRFQGGDQAHRVDGPLGYVFYIPILLLGMMPWILGLPLLARQRSSATSAERYLWVWAAVIFAFFTLSGSKLPHYILPMTPPLAMLLGIALDRSWSSPGFDGRRVATVSAWSLFLFCLAQGGFMTYYWGGNAFGQRVPGFHAEVHSLAGWLKSQPGDVVVYQMPRRSKALGTGKPKVQETSHPSINFVLGRNVWQIDKLDELAARTTDAWILTRWNRLSEQDIASLRAKGRYLSLVETSVPQDLYRVYRLSVVE